MRTVRIIVSGEDCSRIMVTNVRTRKGFLSFLSEKRSHQPCAERIAGKDEKDFYMQPFSWRCKREQ